MKRYEQFKTSEYAQVPELYDSVGKVVRFGFTQETKQDEDGNDVQVYRGYNIPLTGHMDYGHVKSQIIEHIYPPKEEFAIVNNTVSALIRERAGINDPSIEEDINTFIEFEEWRTMASEAARHLMDTLK